VEKSHKTKVSIDMIWFKWVELIIIIIIDKIYKNTSLETNNNRQTLDRNVQNQSLREPLKVAMECQR
jgi:hypothetical protein